MEEKKRIKIGDVLDNDLNINCLTLLQSLSSDDIVKRKGYCSGKNNYHLLSCKERYIIDTNRILDNIQKCLLGIDHVMIFLKRFYGKSYYESNDINIIDYSYYHYEMFLYKLSTLRDLHFKLVNQIYKLGLDPDHCKYGCIEKQIDKINNPILFDLIALYKNSLSFQSSKIRNKSAHEGELAHKAFNEVDHLVWFEQLMKKHPTLFDGKYNDPDPFLQFEVKAKRKEFQEELEIHRYNAFMITRDILISLYKDFDRTVKILS